MVAMLVLAVSAASCSDSDSDKEDGSSKTTTSTADSASTSAADSDSDSDSEDPLTVLLTNDDGVSGAGLDAMAEALSVEDGIEVVVVAPADDKTGSGGRTTPGELVATETTTVSGYPATAVQGHPADSVIWALDEGGIEPDVVISGINKGQNIANLIPLSGTVGAARQGAQMGVPAVAVSQGFGDPPDYPTAVRAVLDWLDENEESLRSDSLGTDQITNINVPTCPGGQVQGTVEVPPAPDTGVDLNAVDCTGTAEPVDDATAFLNGWIAVSTIPNTGSVTE
jgi:5'-nucleotidase